MSEHVMVPNGESWSDEALAVHWAELKKILPGDWLPRRLIAGEQVFDDYGCGVYGCVYAAKCPDVVFKVTTDESEARFISLLPIGEEKPGLVRYDFICQLPGQRVIERESRVVRRNVYIIVREAAFNVGGLLELYFRKGPGQTCEDITRKVKLPSSQCVDAEEFLMHLMAFKHLAASVRVGILNAQQRNSDLLAQMRSHVRRHGQPERALQFSKQGVRLRLDQEDPPGKRLAQAIDALDELAVAMENSAVAPGIGALLGEMLTRGMLLADVHMKNIGQVLRGKESTWVITDPGHLIELGEHPSARIPELSEVRP